MSTPASPTTPVVKAQDKGCQFNRNVSDDASEPRSERHSTSSSSYHTTSFSDTLQGHRRRFSVHSPVALSSTTSVASSSSSSSSSSCSSSSSSSYPLSCSGQNHGQSPSCHHPQSSTQRSRIQSAVTITGPPSLFRRIFKAFVGSVHPLDRPPCDSEEDSQEYRGVRCGECESDCGECTFRASLSHHRTMEPTMPKQQSNTDSHRKAVANARQTGRGLLRGGVRPGRSSSVGSDSTHSSASDSSRSSSSSSSGGGKQRRSSVTSSIAGVSIHDDYRKNNSSNDNNNNKSSRTLPNHQEYRQCGIFTSSNNSDHNDIKRRLSFHKTVATEASSRRGSAFSTNSQETAVNLTGINLGDEQDGECEKEDDHGMDLDDDDDDELDSELDAYYDFNEDYDESGNEAGCRRHNSRIRGATETDDLQLELQRRHRRRQALSTRRCLRKASFLSDKTRANSSGSGGYETTTTTTTSPPPHLGPSERASPIHLPEILHLIFQFVMDLTPQEDYSQREIHSCMLVCKQWYLVGQKILWRDIRFKNPTKMELFVDLLKRTETVECLGIENRKQKSQGRKKRSSIMARAQQQDAAAVEHSIMSPLAMQRRIQERAATVKKIVLHKLKTIEDDDIMPLTSWFHNLQIIEFYICERLTDKIVHAVAENCPLLQQLLMPGCAKVTDSGISKIALHCPRMKHLDLRACSSVSDESLLLVAKHCPELWHLNVGRVSSATKITGKSIVEIAKNTNLNTLGLAGCAMTDDAVIEIARHSRSGLHRISLNSCTALTSASVWALMQLCPNLAVLEIKQCLLIADMATLYRFSTRRVLVELCPELNRRLSAYKLELATMNTLIQSSSSNATTQMADGSGLNSTEVPMPIL